MRKICIMMLCVTPLLLGCGASVVQGSTGEYLDSTAVTAKVKGRLFDMLGTDAFSIKVKTYKDTVQLSGFVNSNMTKQRAGYIADNTVGVIHTQNDLIVKN